MKTRFVSSLVCSLAVLLLLAAPAWAHFAWLATDDEGRALLFFNESPAERDYHLPESVAEAEVFATVDGAGPARVELSEVDEEGFVGCRSAEPLAAGATLSTDFVYGNYHGTLLTYSARYAATAEGLASSTSEEGLSATAVMSDGKLRVAVRWNGQPLPESTVTLLAAGAEPVEATTNIDGAAEFDPPAEGLCGVLIGHTDDDAKGEIDGEEYTSASNFLTLTFSKGETKQESSDDASPDEEDEASFLPELPEAVSSFGAAVADGWVYVYSGHTGTAHDHSRANLSTRFVRTRVGGDLDSWEELPMGLPLQGLPLVSHGGKLYRVGGLLAHNLLDEDEDLHSQAAFSEYDPETRRWTDLEPLPLARSSHDAVVIGDKLYAVGGWTLQGDEGSEWIDKVHVYDFADPGAGWTAIDQPFERRALAAGEWNGKLLAIGGMESSHGISQEVNCYDPASGEWTTLADFPGEGMSGFGVSAWNHGGKLYASGFEGVLYQLSDDGAEWTNAGELATPRFFHRLAPGAGKQMLVIGGASAEKGHLASAEALSL
ncbi:hypothetical protein [Pseudobythopirellula maris]|uniref:hypothetical protein n=1 Tax=Pseudobythopirellula maris TaxID=2527991 RepID=UPI0011B6BD21|nr:hypothetical protein [Pseudobythopirellula maris]